MTDDLMERWSSFFLSEAEKSTVRLSDSTELNKAFDTTKCFLFKLLSVKFYNKEAFKRMMKNVWYPSGSFQIYDMGENLFLAACSSRGEKERILSNGPWTFGNSLVICTNYDGTLQITKVPMFLASFWVRMYDLPLDGMNARAVRKIAATLGDVEDVDLIETRPGWGEYVRVRISLDISKPLPRGKRVVVGETDYVWVRFKYEKLPQFCYYCGLLGHGERDCLQWINIKGDAKDSEFPYGSWMRVGSVSVRARNYLGPSTVGSTGNSIPVDDDRSNLLVKDPMAVTEKPLKSLSVSDNVLLTGNGSDNQLFAVNKDDPRMGQGPNSKLTHMSFMHLKENLSVAASSSSSKENQRKSRAVRPSRARVSRSPLTPSKRQLNAKAFADSGGLTQVKKQKSREDDSLVEVPILSAEAEIQPRHYS
ncbi:hypothetical protein F2P56_034974 [Juglans regia]|uniref:Uncharacterized protein LOC109014898 n=2 Tax=Juglans regia TaxID=51240 RepID=A0A2I4H9V2_JUGRE|nr:uncharacterized protein LOC109014898 [Juglans regia]KAF5442303.1 hypothetical protein F2P56_034974 [Juglans regia]